MEKPARRRNSEKRKEKSRVAARSRRERESEIFTALARGLPLPESVITVLDKASIMRLIISYLKLNDLVSTFPTSPVTSHNNCDSLYLSALDGFVVIISPDGDLVYLSENVNHYLGITQVDLMGSSIFEFSHPCDHDEIREVLAVKSSPDSERRSFFIRLKCTLTSKGRYVNLKSASYKVMHCSGKMMKRSSFKQVKIEEKSNDSSKPEEPEYLVALAAPIPHPSNIEIPLDKQAFLSKHSLDMKFTYADDNMKQFLGYSPEDLIGKSLYEYQHVLDAPEFNNAFKKLFVKGQYETKCYRFLAKGGGFAWVLTQATLLYNEKTQKPCDVVCVNFILSGVENRDEVYSSSQLIERKVPRPVAVTSSVISRMPSNVKVEAPPVTAPPAAISPAVHIRPQPATAKIFAPRTEEMNKGFLIFSDEEPGLTMLKDEPEDLTHLAPTAGDDCVPLDLTDMFGDFFSDTYCPLLTTDDLSSSSCPSRTSGDPFFSYREDSNSVQSPSELAKSPENGSLPSLCSPEHGDDQMGLMDLNVDSGGSEVDEDLSLKAPFIPLDEELPLLISAADSMWGDSPSPHRPDTSTLAELLRTTPDTGRPSRCNKRTDHDWFKDTGQPKSAKLSPALSKREQLLRKAPPGVGPPLDRVGTKRSHGDTTRDSSDGSKRTRSELMQQLIDSPRHSVLMNLLGKLPTETLGVVTDVLNQLYLANSAQRTAEQERREGIRLRSISTSLLESNPSAIPSLLDLSQQDCEVNAPVDRNTLLRGQELITALENVDSNYLV